MWRPPVLQYNCDIYCVLLEFIWATGLSGGVCVCVYIYCVCWNFQFFANMEGRSERRKKHEWLNIIFTNASNVCSIVLPQWQLKCFVSMYGCIGTTVIYGKFLLLLQCPLAIPPLHTQGMQHSVIQLTINPATTHNRNTVFRDVLSRNVSHVPHFFV
jgi:hypothetical protein